MADRSGLLEKESAMLFLSKTDCIETAKQHENKQTERELV